MNGLKVRHQAGEAGRVPGPLKGHGAFGPFAGEARALGHASRFGGCHLFIHESALVTA